MGGNLPRWINADEVEEIARQLLRNTSEPFQVLDRAALESAVARPLNSWGYEYETDIIVLAVRLLEGIGQSHCFQQGNKRTAFFSALEFIEINGGIYEEKDSEELGFIVEKVILRTLAPSDLIIALKKRVKF